MGDIRKWIAIWQKVKQIMSNFNVRMIDIVKKYDREVLSGVNLEINQESYIAIEGKSGAGKSTLMNILGLIEGYDGGEFYFNNTEIKNNKDYSSLRLKDIGFIFQNYNLISTLTCQENILLPLMYAKRKESKFDELVEQLGISALLEKKVNVLSGGEKQRVAIARALILNPSMIIADEPTGNLDEANRDIVLDILQKENKKGRAIVVITHDSTVAQKAKKQYVLEGGKLHAR